MSLWPEAIVELHWLQLRVAWSAWYTHEVYSGWGTGRLTFDTQSLANQIQSFITSYTKSHTMQCPYNKVNFLQVPQNRHLIACPHGICCEYKFWFMFCSSNLECYMQYHIVMGRVIMTLDCTMSPTCSHCETILKVHTSEYFVSVVPW